MLENTRTKLREANFFLGHLASVNNQILRREPEASAFFLSAFLSAARSVGDYIEREGGDAYRAWWEMRKKTVTDAQRALLGFTNEQRVKSVHISGPEIDRTEEWVPAAQAQREIAVEGGTAVFFSSAPQSASATRVWRTVIRFTRFPDRPIVEVCREYLDLLKSIVDEYAVHLQSRHAGGNLRG